NIASAAYLTASTTLNEYSDQFRAIFCFDTSSIGSGQTISSGFIKFFVTAKADAIAGDGAISIVLPTPASTSNLQASDYNIANWAMTQQSSDTAISAITTSA